MRKRWKSFRIGCPPSNLVRLFCTSGIMHFSGKTSIQIIPSGQSLGATVEGLDLAEPLDRRSFEEIVRALGVHSVIRFPDQKLSGRNLADFSAQFGDLEV